MELANITWSTGSTVILLALVGLYLFMLIRQYGERVVVAYRTLRKRDRGIGEEE